MNPSLCLNSTCILGFPILIQPSPLIVLAKKATAQLQMYVEMRDYPLQRNTTFFLRVFRVFLLLELRVEIMGSCQ